MNEKSTQVFKVMKKPKEGSHSVCLLITLVDLVYRTDKNCYSQVFLEECKYFFNKKKCLSILLAT